MWRHPASIFDKRRFLPKGSIGIIKRAKHSSKQAEKDVFDPSTGPLVALHDTPKVAHVDITVP